MSQLSTYLTPGIDKPTKEKLTSQGILRQPDEIVEKEITENIVESIQSLKRSRTTENIAALQAITTAASSAKGSSKRNISKVAQRLKVGRKKIARASALKSRILSSEKASWLFTKRVTRHNVPVALKKAAYDYWSKPGVSRPTGNKNDVTRKRTGPKQYVEHATLILEKTQTEIYEDFKIYASQDPALCTLKMMTQRTFESLRPYFVRPARPKDRQTCCCRSHVEIRSLFKATMDFRGKVKKAKASDEQYLSFPRYTHVSDMVEATLCPKENNRYKRECLERRCER